MKFIKTFMAAALLSTAISGVMATEIFTGADKDIDAGALKTTLKITDVKGKEGSFVDFTPNSTVATLLLNKAITDFDGFDDKPQKEISKATFTLYEEMYKTSGEKTVPEFVKILEEKETKGLVKSVKLYMRANNALKDLTDKQNEESLKVLKALLTEDEEITLAKEVYTYIPNEMNGLKLFTLVNNLKKEEIYENKEILKNKIRKLRFGKKNKDLKTYIEDKEKKYNYLYWNKTKLFMSFDVFHKEKKEIAKLLEVSEERYVRKIRLKNEEIERKVIRIKENELLTESLKATIVELKLQKEKENSQNKLQPYVSRSEELENYYLSLMDKEADLKKELEIVLYEKKLRDLQKEIDEAKL